MSYMKPWEAERKAELFKKQTDSEIKIARRTVHRLDVDDPQGRLGYESALELDVVLRAANEVGGIATLQNMFGDPSDVIKRFASAKERQVLLKEVPLSAAYEYVRENHPVDSEAHRKLVVKDFIEKMGDLDIMVIIRRDVLDFIREYKEGYAPTTVGRRLSALTGIVNHYYRDHDVQRINPFQNCAKEVGPGHSAGDRLPLSNTQVLKLIDHLETDQSMRPFTRAVFWLIITTGVGPAEAGGLIASDIVLDDDVPHVWIRPNDVRGLKVRSRLRRLPLVGEALVHAPALLERNCQPKSISAALNKQLKKAMTLESKQAVYSLRHWMADRLRSVGATEAQAKYIMGHSRASSHERYGAQHPELDALANLLAAAIDI